MSESEKWRRLEEWITDRLMGTGVTSMERQILTSTLSKMRSLDGQDHEERLFVGRFDGED